MPGLVGVIEIYLRTARESRGVAASWLASIRLYQYHKWAGGNNFCCNWSACYNTSRGKFGWPPQHDCEFLDIRSFFHRRGFHSSLELCVPSTNSNCLDNAWSSIANFGPRSYVIQPSCRSFLGCGFNHLFFWGFLVLYVG